MCISPYSSKSANFARMKRFTMKVFLNVILLTLLMLTWGCNSPGEGLTGRHYEGVLLDKKYEIDIPGDTIDRTMLIDSVFNVFEALFSSSNSLSVISSINTFNRYDSVFVFNDSTRLFGIVYDLSADFCHNTQHAWDPAIIPLKRNWLKCGGDCDAPDSLLESCSFRELNIRMQEHLDESGRYDRTTILKRNSVIELDFTDVASALAVDYLAEVFHAHNINCYRIIHDGDLRCRGLSGSELGVVPLGMGGSSENPRVDIGNTAYACRDMEDKQYMVHPLSGTPSNGPVIYSAVASPNLTDARIFSQAFLLQDLNSIADYYERNMDSKVHSFIFFQRGDTIQNASTIGFDALILSTRKGE